MEEKRNKAKIGSAQGTRIAPARLPMSAFAARPAVFSSVMGKSSVPASLRKNLAGKGKG